MKKMTNSLFGWTITPTAILTTSVSLATSISTYAQSAHVHGLATLRLAVESVAVEIEFESPAANLLGFEHQAHSAEDKERLEKTVSILQASDNLFVFDRADCKLDNVELDYSGLLSAERRHHGEHHDEHAHDEHREHHDEHNHELHAHKEPHETHSEISANYRFNCSSTDSLSSITVNLIHYFPAIEKINAMWVSEKRQGAENINATNKIIKLTN